MLFADRLMPLLHVLLILGATDASFASGLTGLALVVRPLPRPGGASLRRANNTETASLYSDLAFDGGGGARLISRQDTGDQQGSSRKGNQQ
jgi:hypothetical protein